MEKRKMKWGNENENERRKEEEWDKEGGIKKT